ncbi:pleckstrin/ G-protein interacting- domain protein [Halothece sp. PCC 7418]|nr:pleckstrin/ G-protein interacting- domain protein [Halothece sp. PCC 7418]
MFILTVDQVAPQTAIRRQNSESKKLVAISYRQWLFIQGESYPVEEREVAIKQAREKIDSGQMCLVVFDDSNQQYVVCYLDPTLEPVEQNPPTLETNEELAALVEAIRQAPDLIKNNRHKLRVYPKSIVGSELVDWLCNYLNCSREEAVKVGQSLVDAGWLHHTWDKHNFADEALLYRFYQDERLSLPFVTG